MDSELICNQMKGIYKVKNENLIKCFEEANDMIKYFEKVVFYHIPRSENKLADKLVNQALDIAKKTNSNY